MKTDFLTFKFYCLK